MCLRAPSSESPLRRQNRTSLPRWPVLLLRGGGRREWKICVPSQVSSQDHMTGAAGHLGLRRAQPAQHLPLLTGNLGQSGRATWPGSYRQGGTDLGSGIWALGQDSKEKQREQAKPGGRPQTTPSILSRTAPPSPRPCSLTRPPPSSPARPPDLNPAGASRPSLLNLEKIRNE